MATEKTPTYSAEQEQIIRDAVSANGGVADKALAERLASDPRMNGASGARKARAIIAKIVRMDGVTYMKQPKLSKTGKPVASKADIVSRIAELADVQAERLAGMEASPKLALEALAEALASRDEEVAA